MVGIAHGHVNAALNHTNSDMIYLAEKTNMTVDPILNWVRENPTTALILNSLLVLVLTKIVWPVLQKAAARLWDYLSTKVSKRSGENLYLEWTIKTHSVLPLLPTPLATIPEQNEQKLDRLYVSLSLANGTPARGTLRIEDCIREHSRVVILGHPGAGKTTMLKFIALSLSRARRYRSALSRRAAPQKDDFEKIHRAASLSKALGLRHPLVPIFVSLNAFQDIASWPRTRTLLGAIQDSWKFHRGEGFPDDFLSQLVDDGQCIFLFDAFDEMRERGAQEALASHVGDLAASAPAGNKFVLTSRVVGYAGQLNQYGFKPFVIQPLDWNSIQELVTKWYQGINEPKLAQRLLDHLKQHPRIRELAETPMLLALIALVQLVKQAIPEKRHVLYEDCVKILLERRLASAEVRESYDRVIPSDEALAILQSLARQLHEKGFRDIPREQVEAELLPPIIAALGNSRSMNLSPAIVIENVQQRSQLLTERGLDESGKPVIGFSHLTFQEYLTAVDYVRSWAETGEREASERLVKRYKADPSWWEEVATLYAAQLRHAVRGTFLDRLGI